MLNIVYLKRIALGGEVPQAILLQSGLDRKQVQNYE